MIDKQVWISELGQLREARLRLGGYVQLFPEIQPHVQVLDRVIERYTAVLGRDGCTEADYRELVSEMRDWVQHHAQALALVETRPKVLN